MLKLAGKTALITGGSKGIGFATARLFAREGAKVIITGRNTDDLKKAADKISGDVTYIRSDTAITSDIRTLFYEIEKKIAKLDIVFINAGIAEGGHIEGVSEESFDKQIDINFRGAFFTVKNAIPYLTKNSSIIFVSSVAAGMGIENLSVYTATKAALVSLARSLAADLVSKSIRVNSISPGYIWTPLGKKNNKDNYDVICKSIPLEQRFGTADEIAQVGLFLASDMSSYMTGQDLIVDGGLSTITLANK